MFELKIGRHTYTITESDRFLDNKSCVQLMTQSKEKWDWGHQPSPVLSKRAVKDIAPFEKVYLAHHYGGNCNLFSLREKNNK
jgi:dolichyl-phosphate-mannose--protein O-mannosyl transferase